MAICMIINRNNHLYMIYASQKKQSCTCSVRLALDLLCHFCDKSFSVSLEMAQFGESIVDKVVQPTLAQYLKVAALHLTVQSFNLQIL